MPLVPVYENKRLLLSENNSFEWNFFSFYIQTTHTEASFSKYIVTNMTVTYEIMYIYIYIICAHGILLGIFTKFDARDTIHVAEILLLIDNNSTSILFESNTFRFFFLIYSHPRTWGVRNLSKIGLTF